MVVITILENLGRKSQAFGYKPVFDQRSAGELRGWAGGFTYAGCKVFTPVLEKNLVLAAVSGRKHGPPAWFNKALSMFP